MDDLVGLDLNVSDCSWQLWEDFHQEQCLATVLPLDNDPALSPCPSEDYGSPGSTDSGTANATTTTSTGGKRFAAPSRNAARERTRVRSLRSAFQSLQRSLPAVPPDTKLSKLDVLVLASNYIAHLAQLLTENQPQPLEDDFLRTGSADAVNPSYYHPVKKWPMRSRLYAGNGPYPADDDEQRHRPTAAKKRRNGGSRPYSFERSGAV